MHRLGVALIPHRDITIVAYMQIAQLSERPGAVLQVQDRTHHRGVAAC